MPEGKPAGQAVAVTGASAGVGRAIARAFARRGARLALLARDEARLEATRLEAEELGAQAALALPVDVADADGVEAAAAVMEEEFGAIDVWVNNAMTAVFAPVAETAPEEFRRVTEVTYLGAVYGTLAALRRMRPRDQGTIVQVGSALARRAIPLQASYCGAKHALAGFTEALRCELLHDRSSIRLVMVQLPALNTPQFDWVRARLPRRPQPVPPIFEPELAADAVVWAADHGGREIWVGWPVMKALIGQKLVPLLLDRYLARTGYDAQQTPEPMPGEREGNLFRPVAGEHGARGRFSARAKRHSRQFWIRQRL
jgi:NAD(P)-dependent dehydrogenase (short-subunit alcohol dehydrogenase family)